MYKDRPRINPKSFMSSWQIIKELPKLRRPRFTACYTIMGRVLDRSPLGIGRKARRRVLTATNVNSSVRHQRRQKQAYQWPLPMLNLYFHLCYCWLLFWCWVWDFECLSPGYISLVVDMADGCVLWEPLHLHLRGQPVPFLEEYKRKELKTVKVISDTAMIQSQIDMCH